MGAVGWGLSLVLDIFIMVVLKALFFATMLALYLPEVQCQGSKERFDAILTKFGFSGLPAHRVYQPKEPIKGSATEGVEEQNIIHDVVRIKKVKKRFHTLIGKKKFDKTKKKFRTRVEPLTTYPDIGVRGSDLKLLNERIKNPVYKSRYPGRRYI